MSIDPRTDAGSSARSSDAAGRPASRPSADDELLAAARAGDREALESLLVRHEAQVYRFGMQMCRDPEDAKDVLQDTLLAMARSVRDFRGASSISTWLYSIARSFCLKKRRRSKLAPVLEQSLEATASEAELLADPARAPDESVAGKQLARALAAAIAALEPSYREVLLLRDVEGLTAPEVAEVLGVSTQAVKSRLHRARLGVRERIAPLLAEAAPRPSAAPDPYPDVLTRSAAVEVPASVQATVEAALHDFLTERRAET